MHTHVNVEMKVINQINIMEQCPSLHTKSCSGFVKKMPLIDAYGYVSNKDYAMDTYCTC
jgi:hypothetical protein